MSNKHGSGNVYSLKYVNLSIVADDVWLWVRLNDRQGKHRGKKYCIGTVIAEGQRDALPWTDVTFSTYYYKRLEWTSGWTSPMNKCRATDRRKLRFRSHVGPITVIIFFILWYVLPPLRILGTSVFSHYQQVYWTQKVCIYVYVCMYIWCFRARQHQTVMNEYGW